MMMKGLLFPDVKYLHFGAALNCSICSLNFSFITQKEIIILTVVLIINDKKKLLKIEK
jgi:hypothetical protein